MKPMDMGKENKTPSKKQEARKPETEKEPAPAKPTKR